MPRKFVEAGGASAADAADRAIRLGTDLPRTPPDGARRRAREPAGGGARGEPVGSRGWPASLPSPLPAPPTRLIGRAREVAVVRDLLRRGSARLVTLTGPGGAGKTRVALAAATVLSSSFPAGVVFVDLSAVRDSTLVAPAIARATGIPDASAGPLEDRLAAALRPKRLLLVLDNFEQVAAAAPVVATLLAACPRLAVLATSRAPLRIAAEREFPLPPLAAPDPLCQPPVDRLAEYPAVALFVERARAVRPNFSLTSANAPAVAGICAHLDGLPLAIELAAARIKLFPPAALLECLERRLDLLVGGPRDAPDRHQTLRGAVAWSDDLLSPDERALFRRLAVFAGGFTLQAAQAVCCAERRPAGGDAGTVARASDPPSKWSSSLPPVLDGVTSLVDKSLLRPAADGGAPRVGMLETIREYALERLEASGEAEAVRQRHAEYYLALALEARPELTGARQAIWLERLDGERDNLRAALSWLLERGPAEGALQLAAALWRFWQVRGYLAEGRRWLDRALAGAGDVVTVPRAQALVGAGTLALDQGEYARAQACHEAALALYRELGDRAGIALSLRELADALHQQGNMARAATLLEESSALYRQVGDTAGAARSLCYLGTVIRQRDGYAAALPLYDRSLLLFRRVGDQAGAALALYNLAHLARSQGDDARALALAKEALVLRRDLGYKKGIALSVNGLAILALRRNEWARATRLLAAARALRASMDLVTGAPPEAPQDALPSARAELGEAAFAVAWEHGQQMSMEETIADALAVGGPPTAPAARPRAGRAATDDRRARAGRAEPAGYAGFRGDAGEPAPGRLERLSPRERQVAVLLAQGLTNRQIAAELIVAEGTVGIHVERIFKKLGVHSRAEVAAWAVASGVVPSHPA